MNKQMNQEQTNIHPKESLLQELGETEQELCVGGGNVLVSLDLQGVSRENPAVNLEPEFVTVSQDSQKA